MAVNHAVHFELDLIPDFSVQERLSHRRQVAHDALIRVGIPRTQDGKMFRLIVRQISRVHDRADADGIGFRVGEVGPARAHQLVFELAFAPHEQLLHFFCGLVLVVLTQVAVAAGERDFLGVGRNFLFHQLVIFVLAPLEAFPGND